jgi:hypothetical protein
VALRHLPPRPLVLSLVATVALLLAPPAASAAWTYPPTPNVDGAWLTKLSAVDCSSANSCMAVGVAYAFSPTATGPVAERWDGASWQIVPTPSPPGTTFNPLNGVSCPRPNVCFAVGSSQSSSGTTRPLVELWNGTSWSIQPSPNVPNGVLQAVSCSGLLACTAVGNTIYPSGVQPVAARWDGTGWHVQSTPAVAGSESSGLSAVSCPLKRTCTAVGQSVAGGVTSPLAERWFGRVNSWGLQSAPKPASAESASLTGVSCPDGPMCVAVGGTEPPFITAMLLAERRIGPTWSIQPLPDPPPGTFPPRNFSAVSCLSRRACHATGVAGFQGGPGFIAGHFNGASWNLESLPPAPAPLADTPRWLPGISCPSRLFCMAVGYWQYKFSGGTLAAKWTP